MVDAAVKFIFDEVVYSELQYFDKYSSSFSELERRDRACDVGVSDDLRLGLQTKHQLFTVNHPTNQLICKLVVNVFKRMGLVYYDGRSRNGAAKFGKWANLPGS